MTGTIGEISERIAAALAFDKAASWDPVGLQFGDPARGVVTAAVVHEVNELATQRLIAGNVDLAVAYHPLLFDPTTRLIAGPSAAGRAHRLIANGVALAVVHTAFDVMAGGAADALAAALGVVETSKFGPMWGADSVKVVTFVPPDHADTVAAAMAAAGGGRIGHYTNCSFRSSGVGTFRPEHGADPFSGRVGTLSREDEVRVEMVCPAALLDGLVASMTAAHPYDEPAFDVFEARANAGFIGRQGKLVAPVDMARFAEMVSSRLGGVVRVAGSGDVSTVAVVPGSGGGFLLDNDADVVVTGDVSHHQATAALAAGKAVIDPGHAATERPGVQALYAAVAEAIDGVIDMTDIDPDPWKER